MWEQTASLLAATEGSFDSVPVTKIKEAQAALLHELHSQYRKDMDELNKGDKPSDKQKEVIHKVAKDVAEGYEEKTKEAVKA